MRFSSVVAASATALAGSALAFPVPGYEHDIAARNNEEMILQLRAFFNDNSPRGPEPDSRPKLQRAKKLNPAEVDAALKHLKNKKRSLYLEDLNSINAREILDEYLELATRGPTTPVPNTSASSSSSTTNAKSGPNTPSSVHRSPTIKSSTGRATTNKGKPKQLTAVQKGQQDLTIAGKDYRKAQAEFKKAEADMEAARKMRTEGLNQLGIGSLSAAAPSSQKPVSAARTGSKKRSLDAEELLEALAAREFFEFDGQLVARRPRPRGYRRSLDAEDSLILRLFADEDYDLFGRAPSTPGTPSTISPTTSGSGPAPVLPGQSGTVSNSKQSSSAITHKTPVKTRVSQAGARLRKPTSAERGQQSLLTASTDSNRAQDELKKAKTDLEAARKMRTKAMGELGLGGLDNSLGTKPSSAASRKANTGARGTGSVKRDLYLEEVMEIVARMEHALELD